MAVTSPEKSSRLIGDKFSVLMVSSCTSLPVAIPNIPICPAAFSTVSKPTECSTGSGPVVICERTSSANGRDSALAQAVASDFKGIISLVIYAAGVALAFVSVKISYTLYVLVAVIWLIPDRRFTRST